MVIHNHRGRRPTPAVPVFMKTETAVMKPKKNSGRPAWRPDLLLTPRRGGISTVRQVRPTLIGPMPCLTARFCRPPCPPHPVPPFGLN